MIVRLLGVLVLATTFSSRAALAYCDPQIDRTPLGEFNRSAFVGIVQVARTTWLDEHGQPVVLRQPLQYGTIPGGFDPYSGARYRVTVLRQYKGVRRHALTIFSENSTGRTPLDDSTKYVVFLYPAARDGEGRKGELVIDYCGNSGPLSQADGLLPMLDRLAPGAFHQP